MDLAKDVSLSQRLHWDEKLWEWKKGHARAEGGKHRVVAVDYGLKRNILRCLTSAGCDVTVVPATATAEDILALSPDGIFLSNGPGDPSVMTYAVETTKGILNSGTPVFGICLGHQILALASGLKTFKMHHGHRGLNHPVKNLISGLGEMTSQNHGFAVSKDGIENQNKVEVTHVHLNDGTVMGIRLKDKPAFSVQYHPEASPGPHDSRYLFDQFLGMINESKAIKV